jgi:hypothetical protein
MPGFWAELFPKKTLSAVSGAKEPTFVAIHARVASANVLTSPLSSRTAALILWRFFVHYIAHEGGGRGGRSEVEHYDLLWEHVLGDDVLLATPQGTVLVPSERRSVLPFGGGHGVPLDFRLPPEAAHVLQMPAASLGIVYYDETLFRNGDTVRLTAWVEARARTGREPFRESVGIEADFVARGDLGMVQVMDAPTGG